MHRWIASSAGIIGNGRTRFHCSSSVMSVGRIGCLCVYTHNRKTRLQVHLNAHIDLSAPHTTNTHLCPPLWQPMCTRVLRIGYVCDCGLSCGNVKLVHLGSLASICHACVRAFRVRLFRWEVVWWGAFAGQYGWACYPTCSHWLGRVRTHKTSVEMPEVFALCPTAAVQCRPAFIG